MILVLLVRYGRAADAAIRGAGCHYLLWDHAGWAKCQSAATQRRGRDRDTAAARGCPAASSADHGGQLAFASLVNGSQGGIVHGGDCLSDRVLVADLRSALLGEAASGVAAHEARRAFNA